jgi:hypothetical protein
MKFAVRPELQLALTLLFIMAAYFPTISHPFSLIDDPNIVEYYGVNSTLSCLDVISPGGGIYYRPLVNLSYWLDFRLWDMDSTFMHLENIVAHLANVFLVFLIALRLPISSEVKSLPFLSALLFGLHPINSESVNWIAARTDVFLGMFVFFAFYCLIRAIEEQSKWPAILVYGAAFAGMLTKETALMFLPVAFLVILYWPVLPEDVSKYRIWRTRFLLIPWIISSCLAASILILVHIKGRGNNALSLIFEGGTNIFMRSFEAFGFYVKKVFMPLPLNMALVEVNPLYAIVGIITLCVLIVIFLRVGIPGIFFASSALFIFPALFVATSSFAWTPFGERYLYVPSAFAVIGSLELFQRFLVRWNAVRLFTPIVGIIIVIASIATIQRGILWGDNLALIEDTIEKSPNFGVIRNQYGGLLKLAGHYDEAEKQFKIGLQQKNKESINRILRLNLIWTKIDGKEPAQARNILLSEIGNKATGDVELLKQINRLEEIMLCEALSLEDRKRVVADTIETNESLYQKTHEPHYLYRSGQLALSIGNNNDAAAFFRKAYENARPDAYYREPARRLAERLVAK